MTIAIKRTPEVNQKYLIEFDANTTDHPVTEWAHDPDINSVETTPMAYWKWDETAQKVLPMTDAEQTLVDEYTTKDQVMTDVGLVSVDITDNLPKSPLEGDRLAVHTSYKPEVDDGATWAVWSGAGDDLSMGVDGNGQGPLLHIRTEYGVPVTTVDIEFNPIFGRVWLHEAYLKFTNGGVGDSVSSTIMSYAVPLQQAAYLDLIVDGEWIKYSPQGPGTGTHGFADPAKITLVDREYQADGDWNFVDGNLTPVFTGDGRYKMSISEQTIHKYVNRIPVYGHCNTYFSMSSDETAEIPAGYFIRVFANNVSNTVWDLSVLMEIYRQTTY